ncbi:hypothetical protein ACLI4Y_05530 [Natrialbaceae archaeon A-CW3]
MIDQWLFLTMILEHPIELVLVPLWFAAGGFAGLSIVDPERAFRYENLFQIRDVELSALGVAVQVGMGVLALLIVVPFLSMHDMPFGVVSALSFYGGALAILATHWPPSF